MDQKYFFLFQIPFQNLNQLELLMCRSIRIETNPICLVNFSKMSNNQTLTNCCCYDSRCCTENRIAQPHLNESFHSNGLNLKPSNYRSNIRSDSIMIVNPSKRIDSDIGNDYSDEIHQNYHSDRNHRYRCRICCTRNNFIDSFRESSSTSQQRRNEEFYFDRNIIGSPPLTDQCRCLPYHLDRFICQQSKLFQQGNFYFYFIDCFLQFNSPMERLGLQKILRLG